MRKEKPIIGITMGDPAGIGPEIVVKSVLSPGILRACRPVVVGDKRIVKKALGTFGSGAGMKVLPDISPELLNPKQVNVLDTADADPDQIETGRASAAGGRAVFEDIQRAVKLTEERKIGGFVAGPHNKYSVNLAGIHFAGYPPFLAQLTGSRYAFNMLVAGTIRIVGATLHVALKDVSKTLTPELVEATIRAAGEAVKKLGIENPRLAVAGLNPHCGEEGLFGEAGELVATCQRVLFATSARERDAVMNTLSRQSSVTDEEIHLTTRGGKTLITRYSAETIKLATDSCLL
ncbi:MAG: hypothetical protein HGA30_02700, partial [Anaerolineales bacterium]|nr:hypothetical protein [Anaerolineales bacterium]